jgi:fucose permease
MTGENRTAAQGRRMITAGAFFSQSILGMSRTFLGTALPAIRDALGLSLLQTGTFPALLQLGYAVSVFVGGPLSDAFHKKRILLAGCLLMAGNIFLFGLSSWLTLSLLAMVLIGVGGGLIEASSNSLLIQLYPGREAPVMNLHHFFFAAGSLSAPLLVGALLSRGISWRWAYAAYGLFALGLSIFLFYPRVDLVPRGGRPDLREVGRLFRDRTFLLLYVIVFFGLGVQNGIGYWLVTYLKEYRGFPIGLASTGLFIFFACVGAGRLFTSYLISRFRESHYLLFLFSTLFLTLLTAVLVPGVWAVFFFGLCGLGYSGVFPCLIAMTGKLYRDNPGTAIGTLATATGVGSMVISWVLSLVSQVVSLRAGFLTFELYLAVCILLMLVLIRRNRIASSPPKESLVQIRPARL